MGASLESIWRIKTTDVAAHNPSKPWCNSIKDNRKKAMNTKNAVGTTIAMKSLVFPPTLFEIVISHYFASGERGSSLLRCVRVADQRIVQGKFSLIYWGVLDKTSQQPYCYCNDPRPDYQYDSSKSIESLLLTSLQRTNGQTTQVVLHPVSQISFSSLRTWTTAFFYRYL